MKKGILFVCMLLICLTLAIAVYDKVTTFTNGLETENISLTSKINLTRYLQIPLYAYANSINMTLSPVESNVNFLRIYVNETISDYTSETFDYVDNFSDTTYLTYSYGITPWVNLTVGTFKSSPTSLNIRKQGGTNADIYINASQLLSTGVNNLSSKIFVLEFWAHIHYTAFNDDLARIIFTDTTGESSLYARWHGATGIFQQDVNGAWTYAVPFLNNTWQKYTFIVNASDVMIIIDDSTATLPHEVGGNAIDTDNVLFSARTTEGGFNLSIDNLVLREYDPIVGVRNLSVYNPYHREYNTTLLNADVNLSLNNSAINDILEECNCNNCSISGWTCLIPITFRSDTTGIIQYSDINLTYQWGIDNCTEFSVPAFNITIKDELTGSDLTANMTNDIDFWGDPAIVENYAGTEFGKITFEYCKVAEYADYTGDIVNIVGVSGYGARNFERYSAALEGIFIAYLLSDAEGQTITFNLIDGGSDPVVDAVMKVYRTISGNVTLIFEGNSDFAGQIITFLDPDYKYSFTINATGFPFKEFDLQPIETVYTLKLTTGGTSFYDTPYSGIRYRFRVNNQVTQRLPSLINLSNETINLSFEIEGIGLEEIGINFTNHNYECIPASCSQILATSTGGTVTIGIKVNETGTFNTAFYFKPQGGSRIYVNDGIIKGVPFLYQATASLIQLFQEIKDNTSPNTRTVIAGFVSIIAVGIGAALGIFGIFLILPVVIVNVLFSLPQVGLINPLVGMFMAIFGITVLIFAEMRNT